MEMLSSLGLSVSFLVLATMVAWMMTRQSGIADWKKSVLILAVLWYGLVVYHVPAKMMGWPHSGTPEDKAVVLGWKAIDPTTNPRDAGIYLWMVPKGQAEENPGVLRSLLPHRIFCLESTSVPRAYKFPYSANEHKRLAEAARTLEQGDLLVFKKRGRGTEKRAAEDGSDDSKGQYEVLKFEDIFDKETAEEGR